MKYKLGAIAVWSQLSGAAFVGNNPQKSAVMRLTLRVLLAEDGDAALTNTEMKAVCPESPRKLLLFHTLALACSPALLQICSCEFPQLMNTDVARTGDPSRPRRQPGLIYPSTSSLLASHHSLPRRPGPSTERASSPRAAT